MQINVYKVSSTAGPVRDKVRLSDVEDTGIQAGGALLESSRQPTRRTN